jgi:hypothetical protein
MNIEVRTNHFENSHGRKPKGYGQWAFYMGKETDDLSNIFFSTGNYSDAKRQACAKARRFGITVVTVGS